LTLPPHSASLFALDGRARATALPFMPVIHLDRQGSAMTHITYKVVRHDDGWAYTVDGVFSEAFPTHAAALAAARRAAAEQRVPGSTEAIEWEDEHGRWHSETARGSDRPETDVQDTDG
jgi:uncharacterized protein DUF2188